MLIVALLACWRPDPALAPPPPVPFVPADGAPEDDGGDAAAAGAEDQEDEGDEGDEGDEEPPGLPPAPPVDPYPAVTLTRPVTVVDDAGQPLGRLEQAGLAVEVIAEDAVRKRVRCGTCTPPLEGWVQADRVGRAPGR